MKMDRFYQETTKMDISKDAVCDMFASVFDYIILKLQFKTNHAGRKIKEKISWETISLNFLWFNCTY